MIEIAGRSDAGPGPPVRRAYGNPPGVPRPSAVDRDAQRAADGRRRDCCRATTASAPAAHVRRQSRHDRRRTQPGRGTMTKHSPYERARRAAENERMKQVEAAWYGSLSSETARAFPREVEAAHARGRVKPPPNQPRGTLPNPPRPGREPKPPKEERRPSRGGG